MSSYYSLDYTGSFESLQNFFTSQGWRYEIKHISNNKSILKTYDDNAKELRFFSNTDNETYNIKYENV